MTNRVEIRIASAIPIHLRSRLPAPPAIPVTTAAKEQYKHYDYQNQFHITHDLVLPNELYAEVISVMKEYPV